MPPASNDAETDPDVPPSLPDRGLRSSGMRDLGPQEMQRFRRVERAFLDVCARHDYREIRTPAIEPLHLYTATGSLSPQLLDGVYSFLDWDGWSGERVVLRPDSTVPAARWYEEQQNGDGAARLCYVQPVYRFAAEGDRELWQCGVELFGLAAPQADAELLLLARDFLTELGLEPRFELAHAGLVRVVLAAAGLERAEQVVVYDRLLAGDADVVDELVQRSPDGASAIKLLFDVDEGGAAYVANLRGALLPFAPDAAQPLDEMEAAVRALDEAGCAAVVRTAPSGSFEYYSGLTFTVSSGGEALINGGRYDGLVDSLGDREAPACGFAADILSLAALATGPGQ